MTKKGRFFAGDAAVEDVAGRLLEMLRYCKGQPREVESNDRRYKHVYVPLAAAVE